MWGPLPVRYLVRAAPEGWSIRNGMCTGRRATSRDGEKPANRYVRAAPIVICGGEDEELQPASATASRTAIAAGFTRQIEASSSPEPPD